MSSARCDRSVLFGDSTGLSHGPPGANMEVDEESIFRLNGIGYSVNEIVRETGINRDIVIRRLKKYNLPSNSKKEKIVDMFKIYKMLENNIDKILICEEFNISLSTLNRKLKKHKK